MINSKEKLYELLNLIDDSDLESTIRIIVVKEDKKWRETIFKGIEKDTNIFKGRDFVLSGKRYLDDEFETKSFKGILHLALHNLLASLKTHESIIISVENKANNYNKGVILKKTKKVIYVVLKD